MRAAVGSRRLLTSARLSAQPSVESENAHTNPMPTCRVAVEVGENILPLASRKSTPWITDDWRPLLATLAAIWLGGVQGCATVPEQGVITVHGLTNAHVADDRISSNAASPSSQPRMRGSLP